mgnify:CR=1
MREGFGDRLREIRKALGFTIDEAAEMAGLKQAKSWGSYERGQAMPKIDALYFLVDRGLNLDWLATGEGEMRTLRDARNALVHQGRFSDVAAACLEYLGEQRRELHPDKAGAFLLATYMAAEREFEREGNQMSAAEFKACVRRILQIHDALTD